MNQLIIWILLLHAGAAVHGIPDQGKWDFQFTEIDNIIAIPKSLYEDSKIYIHITCDSEKEAHIIIQWILTEAFCWQEYMNLGESIIAKLQLNSIEDGNKYIASPNKTYACSDHIILEELTGVPTADKKIETKKDTNDNSNREIIVALDNKKDENKNLQLDKIHTDYSRPVYTIQSDGVYLLTLHVQLADQFTDEDLQKFKVDVHLEMKGPYGYLSASDSLLLPFYGVMCLVYVTFGIVWLVVSFLQWRDLLRIQFWIGAVIFLGMLEKALFYAEYQNINSTGEPTKPSAAMIAEIISCAKRTLARMLVIIVSLGFGIVKPRLGSHLHKIISVGLVYFVSAVWEAYLRVMKSKTGPVPVADLLLASVPLALLDSTISYWILSNLVQTTRTLRLRRNIVKLTLYEQFTKTLVFAIIASVLFMLYSTKTYRMTDCLKDWQNLWLDNAFWHFLFSFVLLVIMILWRPTNNNQRYAFSPLLDAADDEDDEDIEHYVSDSYVGVKMRGIGRNDSPKDKLLSPNSADDDLKWVEEHIPSSIMDSALPIMDSDEEIMNTKFEISKMA